MRETPGTLEEAASIIQAAFHAKEPLRLLGTATKKDWPAPVKTRSSLSSEGLSGIIAYEPEELLLTVKAGTKMEEIHTLLKKHGQTLPFDPPDYSALFQSPHAGTLGGMISANLSGPRRFSKGSARDYVLAVKAVNGQGQIFKAGAKVVKNVTGYDLPKLLTGAFGTLAFLGEITVKTLPAPTRQLTLLFEVAQDDQAAHLLRLARQSDKDIAAACYLPDDRRIALLLEGGALPERAAQLEKEAGAPAKRLWQEESDALWHELGNAVSFADASILWRMAVPPDQGMQALKTLRQRLPRARYLMDWGGALIWIGSAHMDQNLGKVAEEMSGHITCLVNRSGEEWNKLFSPLPLSLMKKVKAAFDPGFIFNPGKLHPEL